MILAKEGLTQMTIEPPLLLASTVTQKHTLANVAILGNTAHMADTLVVHTIKQLLKN